MSLSSKEKELVALGASLVAGCIPCTTYHFKKCWETGVSGDEIQEAVYVARSIRNSTSTIMENLVNKHLGIFSEKGNENRGFPNNPSRINELVSIAAAFAVNSTSNLNKHVAAALTISSITEDEIKSVLDIAGFIKTKAASHVERIAEKINKTPIPQEKPEDLEGCSCNNESLESVANSTEEPYAGTGEDCGCGGEC
ncbi:MAG: carboxymuconolactone decarboxylase family protein [Fidelibacterota bacterium]